jgi:hypothetical protein
MKVDTRYAPFAWVFGAFSDFRDLSVFRILSIMSIQPDLVLGMSAVYTDCSSKFQALTLPKVPNCERNFGTSNAKASLAVLGLLSWTLILQCLISKM